MSRTFCCAWDWIGTQSPFIQEDWDTGWSTKRQADGWARKTAWISQGASVLTIISGAK